MLTSGKAACDHILSLKVFHKNKRLRSNLFPLRQEIVSVFVLEAATWSAELWDRDTWSDGEMKSSWTKQWLVCWNFVWPRNRHRNLNFCFILCRNVTVQRVLIITGFDSYCSLSNWNHLQYNSTEKQTVLYQMCCLHWWRHILSLKHDHMNSC